MDGYADEQQAGRPGLLEEAAGLYPYRRFASSLVNRLAAREA